MSRRLNRALAGWAGLCPHSGYGASPRLDAVVKALIGTSREEAARLIAAGLVSLNHLPSLSASAPVREGDCLSVRGKGRYMVDALGPPTRKGRLALSARKCV